MGTSLSRDLNSADRLVMRLKRNKNETSEPRVDELAADFGSDLGVSVYAHNLKQALLLLRRDVLLVPVPNVLKTEATLTHSVNLTSARTQAAPGATAQAARAGQRQTDGSGRQARR
jgi:hypothetical protein